MREWTGYPEEHPDLLEERRRYEEELEFQREQAERQEYEYYIWYHTAPEAWIERFCDWFVDRYKKV